MIHALCPFCGSTIQVRKDGKIRYHRGPNPAFPDATYCKRGMGTVTTGWPEHIDSQGRTVRTHPGEFAPGRLVASRELLDLVSGPDWAAAGPAARLRMLDRFEIRVKEAGQ